jgi:hypothetical protein
MSVLENSYLAKVIVTLGGAAGMLAAIAGGFYTVYQFVTYAGN